MNKNEIITKELSSTELQRAMDHNLEVMTSRSGISLDENQILFRLTDEYVDGDKTTSGVSQHKELDNKELDNKEDKPIEDGLTQRKAYYEQDKPPYEVVGVECSQLQASPQQKREDFNERELNALADSIEKDGLLQPVPVYRVYDDQYQYSYHLVGGERRKRAWEIVNNRQGTNDLIPCTVLAEYTEAGFNELDNQIGMLLQGIAENRHRASLNFIEMSKAIRAYKDYTNESNDAIAERIFTHSLAEPNHPAEQHDDPNKKPPQHRKATQVTYYLKISRLSQEVHQAIQQANRQGDQGGDDQTISLRHAYEITKLKPPQAEGQPTQEAHLIESQLKLIEAIKESQLSVKSTQELVARINQGTPPQGDQSKEIDQSIREQIERQQAQAKKTAQEISERMGVQANAKIQYDHTGAFTKAVVSISCGDLQKYQQIEALLNRPSPQ